jgi:hypothetical protein
VDEEVVPAFAKLGLLQRVEAEKERATNIQHFYLPYQQEKRVNIQLTQAQDQIGLW